MTMIRQRMSFWLNATAPRPARKPLHSNLTRLRLAMPTDQVPAVLVPVDHCPWES